MGFLKPTGAKVTGQAPLMNESQMGYLNQIMENVGPEALQSFQQFLQPYDASQQQDLFQQSFIDPAMQVFEQQALPAIQQRFVDQGAGSSSALNQALGQSATDLSTMLGGQMGQFAQGQQGNQMNALQLLNQMMGTRAQDPMIQKPRDILGDLLGSGTQVLSAYAGSGFGK